MRVRSLEPETIVFPSGEKATEKIEPLCAFVFSPLSSSVAVQETRNVSFDQRKAI